MKEGILFCPDADPSDGTLDICVANNIPKSKFLIMLPLALKGKHLGFKGINNYKCKKVEIRCASPKPLHTDGEPVSFLDNIIISCGNEQLTFITG
jgi:diacylglycerol kinase family enzyme